ncbi:MAG TPA: ABC transporter permease [Verrucomicrobiae bacterium]|nr:ABC transporter permease [Verrucomicrobiae bacterium]
MSELTHLSPNQRAWRRFRRQRVTLVSTALLSIVVLLALIWPVFGHPRIAAHLPHAMTWSPVALTDAQFQPPGAAHWFGTDVHGRDLLSRVFYGARISLLIGVVGALVSLLIGVLWGAVAGYVGGRWDALMMRFVDILYSLPSIVFVIVLIAVLEESFKAWLVNWFSAEAGAAANLLLLFVGLGAVSWLTMARIVRGQVLSLRTRSFVEASRSLGAGHARILLRHILPNVYGIIITYLTLTVPAIILYESFLSYLGLGIQPPQASLGYLIADGADSINPIRIYWWLIVFPGALLTTTLLALNFLGDALRDAWDPRAAMQSSKLKVQSSE